MAERLGLPPGWLNDAVKGFLAGDDPDAAPVLEVPGLRCLAASPRMPLALKVLAHRVGEDEDDVLLLAVELGLRTATDVLQTAEAVYGDRLDAAARFFVEELFDARPPGTAGDGPRASQRHPSALTGDGRLDLAGVERTAGSVRGS